MAEKVLICWLLLDWLSMHPILRELLGGGGLLLGGLRCVLAW